jgi:glutamine phosphoribosylpyrophosphate amidotransferase
MSERFATAEAKGDLQAANTNAAVMNVTSDPNKVKISEEENSFKNLLRTVVGDEIAATAPITDHRTLVAFRDKNGVRKIAVNQQLKKSAELNTAEMWKSAKLFLWGAAHVQAAAYEV